jgi:hypothetical protein
VGLIRWWTTLALSSEILVCVGVVAMLWVVAGEINACVKFCMGCLSEYPIHRLEIECEQS